MTDLFAVDAGMLQINLLEQDNCLRETFFVKNAKIMHYNRL